MLLLYYYLLSGILLLAGYRCLTAYRKSYHAHVPYRLPKG